MGRNPVRAIPPATAIISSSRIPTLMTRSGCRTAAAPNSFAEISATTMASRGSESSRSVATRANRSRIVSVIAQAPRRRPRMTAVSERSAPDLDARDEQVVGVVAEPAIEVAEAVELVVRDEALGRQHRVIGHRPVPLRQQEPIPGGIVHGRWSHAEDAVVKDPQNVEGGMRARIVLLVAGEPAQKRRQVAVAESCNAHG